MPQFRHVIITRFNVRYGSAGGTMWERVRSSPEWLARRFQLFETYCLPTVIGQTSQNFTWLLYFDTATPAVFVERARRVTAACGNIRILFCETYGDGTLAGDLVREITPAPQWLLTTRLDNDDGLHCDFVARLQNALAFGDREALNFPCGVIYCRGRTYLHHHYSNAFLSLFEPFDGFRTVLCVPHEDVAKMAPVRQLDGPPAWLQVIHQANVSNRVHGRRVPKDQALQGFLIDGSACGVTPDASPFAMMLDNRVAGSWRDLRDSAFGALKKLRSPGWRR